MSRRRTKEGYLVVKQPGRFGKSWKRKWVVAQPNNTRSQVGEMAPLSVLLELYVDKGAYGKTVNSVLVEGATEIRRVFSKSNPLAFEVRKGESVLLSAAGESEADSQEWVAMFRQQLLLVRKKELVKLPDAAEDAYRVSVIPNKYSETLQLSGDMLAHVTSMTFGLYDLYEGSLIKEWDLRHTKKFSLQSKGPQKDVDKIAIIQISNRSPHGAGDILLYSLNAKTFLEKIYENLNSAMEVKSKRTRTSSMLFEIPPKELEALGKEIKEGPKATTNGANGSAPKDDAPTANGPPSQEPSENSETQSNEAEKEMKKTSDEKVSIASDGSTEKEGTESTETHQGEGDKPAAEINVETTTAEDKQEAPKEEEPTNEREPTKDEEPTAIPSTEVKVEETEESKTPNEEERPAEENNIVTASEGDKPDTPKEDESLASPSTVVKDPETDKIETPTEEETKPETPKEGDAAAIPSAEVKNQETEESKTPTEVLPDTDDKTPDEPQRLEESKPDTDNPTEEAVDDTNDNDLEVKDETTVENVPLLKEEAVDEQKDTAPSIALTETDGTVDEVKQVEENSNVEGNTQETEVEVHSTDAATSLETPTQDSEEKVEPTEDEEKVHEEKKESEDITENFAQEEPSEPTKEEVGESTKDSIEPKRTEETNVAISEQVENHEGDSQDGEKEGNQDEKENTEVPKTKEEESVTEGVPDPQPEEVKGDETKEESTSVVIDGNTESTPEQTDKLPELETPTVEDDGTQTTFGDEEDDGVDSTSNEQSGKPDESKECNDTASDTGKEENTDDNPPEESS